MTDSFHEIVTKNFDQFTSFDIFTDAEKLEMINDSVRHALDCMQLRLHALTDDHAELLKSILKI